MGRGEEKVSSFKKQDGREGEQGRVNSRRVSPASISTLPADHDSTHNRTQVVNTTDTNKDAQPKQPQQQSSESIPR